MSKAKQNISIVNVELTHIDAGKRRVLKGLMSACADVTSYLIHVICDHYDEISTLSSFEALTKVEQLIHHTKQNQSPEYEDFDIRFNRLPSYIRRAAIHAALGHVQSHEARCDQYYKTRQAVVSHGHRYKKMEPGFTFTPNVCPTLYRKESFAIDVDTLAIGIKVFMDGHWVWLACAIPNRDAKCLKKAMAEGKALNPKLVYKYHKFYLQFPIEHHAGEFPKLPLNEQLVLGVDLGLNRPAVCSVMDMYGTVHGRVFAPFKEDMARIDHIINKIRKAQATSGKGQSLSSLYTKLQGLKENYVRQLSHWIAETAGTSGVYGIVLEHLGSIHRGKGRGSLKARVHHWCVAKMRDLVKGLAFRKGIRVFLINPKGTSMYAFDGSGKVVRDEDNYSLCTFQSGKRYDCDLSASYNIAARYFLRAINKSIPEKGWSALQAKVPELSKRTMWTLSTLRSVTDCMATSPQKACAA